MSQPSEPYPGTMELSIVTAPNGDPAVLVQFENDVYHIILPDPNDVRMWATALMAMSFALEEAIIARQN